MTSEGDSIEQIRQQIMSSDSKLDEQSFIQVLSNSPEKSREQAIKVLELYLEKKQPSITRILEELLRSLSEDDSQQRFATQAIYSISESNPNAVSQLTPNLVKYVQSDHHYVQKHILKTFLQLAQSDPGLVAQFTDEIVSTLSTNQDGLKNISTLILSEIAKVEPSAILEVQPTIFEEIQSKSLTNSELLSKGATTHQEIPHLELELHGQHRLQSLHRRRTLSQLVGKSVITTQTAVDLSIVLEVLENVEDPVIISSLLDVVAEPNQTVDNALHRLIPLCNDFLKPEHTPSIRAKAAFILSMLFERDESTIVEGSRQAFPELLDLLDHEDPEIRSRVAILCSYIAEYDPHRIMQARQKFHTLLTDSDQSTRASALWTLKFIQNETTKEKIQHIATTDANTEIKQLATEILHSIE